MAAFKRVAHRGASGAYPENTRVALIKAIESRADMIELDCQMTKDGHVVVFHDETLERTAGVRGTVRASTLAQLKALDLGRWKGKAHAGERILTLEEAIAIVRGAADLCLEIKSRRDLPSGIELKMLFTLSHFDYLDRAVFSSFDYWCLARLREFAPEAKIAVLFGDHSEQDPFDAVKNVGASALHVQKDLASRGILEQAWELGIDVFVWTVNEATDIETFASMGVQGLISDFPDRLWNFHRRSAAERKFRR